MRRGWLAVAAVVVVVGAGLYWRRDIFVRQAFAPTPLRSPMASFAGQAFQIADVEVVAEDLEIPWELAWLPSGELLITERPGRLLKIGADRSVIEIIGVAHVGEGGLQGMALHPQFSQNHWIYLYLTTRTAGVLSNRVERYVLNDDTLTDRTVIIDTIPGSQVHDGGRIAFGDDGLLYVTTGDAGTPAAAQDRESLAGKILRIKDDGTIPLDNPFANAVYSYGHRNPQGLTWDEDGNLWSTEHGRSGAQSGFDEINLIVAGGNYGWPDSEGEAVVAGTRGPILHSGATTTWAPAGAAVYEDLLLFGGLRGEALFSANITGDRLADLTAHFQQEWGRIRGVRVGPDGWVYITTSNTDGRGETRAGDDKVIRLNPEKLLPL